MMTLRGGGLAIAVARNVRADRAQATFCFVVLFGAVLFVATFDKLAHPAS